LTPLSSSAKLARLIAAVKQAAGEGMAAMRIPVSEAARQLEERGLLKRERQRNPADLTERYYLELKPNTPTGRAAAARAAKRYFDATGRPVRPIYYDPKDFI
jgi:hypothetical protein